VWSSASMTRGSAMDHLGDRNVRKMILMDKLSFLTGPTVGVGATGFQSVSIDRLVLSVCV